MDQTLLLSALGLVGLVGFDLAALRYGRDSRRPGDKRRVRRDWW